MNAEKGTLEMKRKKKERKSKIKIKSQRISKQIVCGRGSNNPKQRSCKK